ncbi:MAG TPA: amidophosphoribosyltransferase [Elusimicrobia bacterium]|nr:amidophosphoribosyltransferase [Elusimicrobiota bacterium]
MCGIFVVAGNKEAARIAYVGLFTLQHRGQESAGIVTEHKGRLLSHRGMGLVGGVFSNYALDYLEGTSAVGHVRYSTAGSSEIKNAQPLFFKTSSSELAVAHNGNLTNAARLRKELGGRGAIFQSATDSELIVHLIARCNGSELEDAAAKSLPKLRGGYAFAFMAPGKIIGARDPLGIRPLVLGRLGGAWLMSSETCAIEVVGGRVIREVEPGEMVTIRGGKLFSKRFAPRRKAARCVFEQVYFARPDSVVCGRTVQLARHNIGSLLASELKNIKADLVSGVPDSGTAYALGFSQRSGIPYKTVFMRNHYSGRSFIQPDQKLREFTAHLKLAPIRDVIKGKSIILVDDSLVRGTTSRRIIGNLKRAGAKKVIMAVASPPVMGSCFYGIDTPDKSDLIANRMPQEGIRKFICADGLYYLSPENLIKACGNNSGTNFCSACFTGKYPL